MTLADPAAVEHTFDNGRQIGVCRHCDQVVALDPSDMRPNWYHTITGSRVCHARRLDNPSR